MAMEALNVPAVLLNASSTCAHANHVHKAMTDNNPSIKLLYVTPEKLAKSKRFMTKLQKMYKIGNFSLLAIDEVHCCSQWGHDFRPGKIIFEFLECSNTLAFHILKSYILL